MFLLTLPTVVSMLIVIFVSTLLCVGLHYVVHPFWAREVTEDTKKTADNIAMRIGVVYSVVIGMMLTNVRAEHVQMVEAIESEASALVRLYNYLERNYGEDSQDIRGNIVEYVRFIVNEQWPALREARVQVEDQNLGGRLQLDAIWDYVLSLEGNTAGVTGLNLPKLLDELEHYRALRLFDTKGNLLPIFWYIAIFGYIASVFPLYVYSPNFRRCALISLYSGMVSVVLLGIYILSHPYSAAAGVEPDIFRWLLEAAD